MDNFRTKPEGLNNIPEFWFYTGDGKEKKATLKQLIDVGFVTLNQDIYELTPSGKERLRQDEYLRENRTYDRDEDPELWDELFKWTIERYNSEEEIKFYVPSVEGVEIKEAEDYPEYKKELSYDPGFNMTPSKVINFLRFTGYDVNSVRYNRKLERLSVNGVPPFPNPLDNMESDKLMDVCKFQALKWHDVVEKIEFKGEDATLYIIAEDKCYSKVIRSGEPLNIPSTYGKDRKFILVMIDCRPEMIATVIDYYEARKYGSKEVTLPEGFVECDFP